MPIIGTPSQDRLSDLIAELIDKLDDVRDSSNEELLGAIRTLVDKLDALAKRPPQEPRINVSSPAPIVHVNTPEGKLVAWSFEITREGDKITRMTATPNGIH